MKRRIGLMAASALLATVGVFAPASPASAADDVCAGTGTAVLTAGLGLPLVTTNTAGFTFNFTAGVCATKGVQLGTLFATGHVHGACGHSGGAGTTTNGHDFHFASMGTVLVLGGEVTGVVSAVSNVAAGGSCTNKTAQNFLITGAVVLTHVCDTTTTAC